MGQRLPTPTYLNLYSTSIICCRRSIGSLPRSPPDHILPACLGTWTGNLFSMSLFLYAVVHCLLWGFLWPCCYTKKVTWWRPKSHGNTVSLFDLIIGAFVLHAACHLTRIFAKTQQKHSVMNVLCTQMNISASLTSVDFACYSALYFV